MRGRTQWQKLWMLQRVLNLKKWVMRKKWEILTGTQQTSRYCYSPDISLKLSSCKKFPKRTWTALLAHGAVPHAAETPGLQSQQRFHEKSFHLGDCSCFIFKFTTDSIGLLRFFISSPLTGFRVSTVALFCSTVTWGQRLRENNAFSCFGHKSLLPCCRKSNLCFPWNIPVAVWITWWEWGPQGSNLNLDGAMTLCYRFLYTNNKLLLYLCYHWVHSEDQSYVFNIILNGRI